MEANRFEVELDENITTCDCCGKTKLGRTFCIYDGYEIEVYLGRVCAKDWFGLDLSGNPYRAIERLRYKIKRMTNDEIEELIEYIKEFALHMA